MFNQFIAGSTSLSLLVIVLFFLRFWIKTRDRLFLYFAGSFGLMMVERIIRACMAVENDWAPYVYTIRLAAFALIILAVVEKNREP